MADLITIDEVKKALPPNLRSWANQGFVDKLNNINSDPLIASQIRENFINYSHILNEGKYKTEDYLNAVMYVSFKLMGYSNQDSYIKAFPQRYSNLVANGATMKDISAYVSAYAKGKLVNQIMEQSIVPSWVLNQDAYQEAINKQVELMRFARSERVQAMAADSLLKNLAKPEAIQGPLINIDMQESSVLKQMKESILELAKVQKEAISKGQTTAKVVAEQNIIDVVAHDTN